MATRDKIILHYFRNYKEIYLEDLIEGDVAFTLKEFENVEIEFLSTNAVYLEMEYPNSDEMLKLLNGDRKVLNSFSYDRQDGEENNTFYPSQYYFCINKNDRKYKYYFQVHSNALNDNVEDIRQIVRMFSNGLELNVLKKYRGMHEGKSDIKNHIVLFDKIIDAGQSLYFEIEHIVKYPLTELVKETILTRRFSKSTKKKVFSDLKHNIQNGTFEPRKSIREKKRLTLNIDQNYRLKLSLKVILSACMHSLKMIDDYLSIMKEERKKLHEPYETQKRIYEIKGTGHSQTYKNSVYSTYKYYEEQIKRNENEYSILFEKKQKILNVQNFLLWVLNETWLTNIDENKCIYNCEGITRNYHYKKIFDFSKSLNVNFNEDKIKNKGYEFKETYKLYELYVLILLFSILEESGYDSLHLDEKLNALFESNEYKFVKESKNIRIIYDKVIVNSDTCGADQLGSQNSVSNRPDIVLMYYEEEVLVKTIVIEVKCRSKSKIYKKNGDTEVVSQLKDYTNFWYLDREENLKKDVINRVYCIYPDNNIYKKYINRNQICILSLKPTFDFIEDESYLAFSEEIKKYI